MSPRTGRLSLNRLLAASSIALLAAVLSSASGVTFAATKIPAPAPPRYVHKTHPQPSPSPTPASDPSPSPSPVASPSPSPSAPPSPVPSDSPTPPAPPAPPPAPGSFPVAYFAPDFGSSISRTFSQQFIQDMGGYLQVSYPAGSSAPSSGVPGGAQASLPLASGPVDNATLTYKVRFPSGFQFVKGGKMPGLCGGACYTGGTNGQAGWSARFMWRTGGAAESYVYSATTSGYGDSLGRGDWYWTPDSAWHTVSQHVHMNTPGVADGTIDVSIDGVPVSHQVGITFRVDGSVHIDSLMFSTFYGGHDSSWAPTADQHLDFAEFHLTVG